MTESGGQGARRTWRSRGSSRFRVAWRSTRCGRTCISAERIWRLRCATAAKKFAERARSAVGVSELQPDVPAVYRGLTRWHPTCDSAVSTRSD